MAARNPFFYIKDVPKLQGWLDDVTEELATGKTAVQFDAGDSSGQDLTIKDATASQRQVWLLERLSQLAPDLYPSTEGLYPVRRTRPRYLR